jgi:hypothetical protein
MDVCRFYDITDGFFGSSCPWESSLRGDEVGRETPLTGCTAWRIMIYDGKNEVVDDSIDNWWWC